MLGLAIAGTTILILAVDLLGFLAEIRGLLGRGSPRKRSRRSSRAKSGTDFFRTPEI
jgi:hypothetical protein